MLQILIETWKLTVEAGVYILIGFGIASLLHRYLPSQWLVSLLGKGKFRPTVTAALVGVPLPLCSCSVVPTALALQKKGASRGATLAFFISTPETGVDSILVTYGLLGPVMAVARPLAASMSAITAGILLEFLPDKTTRTEETPSCCAHKQETIPIVTLNIAPQRGIIPLLQREARGLWHSFQMLFDEVAMWILIGLVLSGILTVYLPQEWLSGQLGQGWSGMALAIVVGLPMYVCATASTPLVAVLMGKGLSAGAALVFLLVGPATNIGTMGIVTKTLGGWAVFAYLLAITVIAVVFGVVVDTFWPGMTVVFTGTPHSHEELDIIGIISAGGLLILLLWRTIQGNVGKMWRKT